MVNVNLPGAAKDADGVVEAQLHAGSDLRGDTVWKVQEGGGERVGLSFA